MAHEKEPAELTPEFWEQRIARSKWHFKLLAAIGGFYLAGWVFFAVTGHYPELYLKCLVYLIWANCAHAIWFGLQGRRLRRKQQRAYAIRDVNTWTGRVMDAHHVTGNEDGRPGYCAMCPGTVSFPCPQYLTAQHVFSLTDDEKWEAVSEERLVITMEVEVPFEALPEDVQDEMRRRHQDGDQ